MTAIEAIKKGFASAKNLISLMIIVLVFNFASAIIMLAVIGINPTQEEVATKVGPILFLSAAIMMVWVLLEGGIFSSIHSRLSSNQLGLESFVGNCFKFFGRLLGLNILSGAIVFVLWIFGAFFTGLFVAMGQAKNPFFNAIGIIFMAVAVICSFCVSIPMLIGQYILVTSDGKIMASLKRSFTLFRANIGRILFLFFLLILIFFMISFLTNVIGILAGKILPAGWILGILNTIITSVVNGAYGIFASCTILGLILSLDTPAIKQRAEGSPQA